MIHNLISKLKLTRASLRQAKEVEGQLIKELLVYLREQDINEDEILVGRDLVSINFDEMKIDIRELRTL